VEGEWDNEDNKKNFELDKKTKREFVTFQGHVETDPRDSRGSENQIGD